MTPKEVVKNFVEAFNNKDADRLTELYSEDAVNHQVAEEPVCGRSAIHKMFRDSFVLAEMVCNR